MLIDSFTTDFIYFTILYQAIITITAYTIIISKVPNMQLPVEKKKNAKDISCIFWSL